MFWNDIIQYATKIDTVLTSFLLVLCIKEIQCYNCSNANVTSNMDEMEETYIENEIKVGFLSTVDAEDKNNVNRIGVIINGVMPMVVEHINNRSDLLPNHTLTYTWSDTHGHELGNINTMTEQWKNGVVAFFGPENTCTTEARIAAAWNIPMISYVSIYSILLLDRENSRLPQTFKILLCKMSNTFVILPEHFNSMIYNVC